MLWQAEEEVRPCSAIVTSENRNQPDSIIPDPPTASCNYDNLEPMVES